VTGLRADVASRSLMMDQEVQNNYLAIRNVTKSLIYLRAGHVLRRDIYSTRIEWHSSLLIAQATPLTKISCEDFDGSGSVLSVQRDYCDVYAVVRFGYMRQTSQLLLQSSTGLSS